MKLINISLSIFVMIFSVHVNAAKGGKGGQGGGKEETTDWRDTSLQFEFLKDICQTSGVNNFTTWGELPRGETRISFDTETCTQTKLMYLNFKHVVKRGNDYLYWDLFRNYNDFISVDIFDEDGHPAELCVRSNYFGMKIYIEPQKNYTIRIINSNRKAISPVSLYTFANNVLCQ